MNDADSRSAGRAAEDQALAHLSRAGLQTVARNWLCRGGELDLVMLDGDTVVFVEVRYRRHSAWGGALESVDARKQKKLILAAQLFLQQEKRWGRHACRFDIVALGPRGSQPTLQWIRNAFDS